jgi:hypothetical protein
VIKCLVIVEHVTHECLADIQQYSHPRFSESAVTA